MSHTPNTSRDHLQIARLCLVKETFDIQCSLNSDADRQTDHRTDEQSNGREYQTEDQHDNDAGDNAVLGFPPAVMLVDKNGGIQSEHEERAVQHQNGQHHQRGIVAHGHADRADEGHDQHIDRIDRNADVFQYRHDEAVTTMNR